MSESLKASDALGAEGATHPRVSVEDMQAAIRSEHYFTAAEAVRAIGLPDLVGRNNPLELLTLCILTMENGFTVVGKSAPASPENFDAAKGKVFAKDDAIRQRWPMMGFSLRDRLTAERSAAI